MKKRILPMKKPRDALVAPRGKTGTESLNLKEVIQHPHQNDKTTINGVNLCQNSLLPMIVMFEQPEKYGVDRVTKGLTGKPPPPPVNVSGQFWSGWYSCRKV